MRNKRPLLVMTGIALVVFYTLFNNYHQTQIWRDEYNEIQLRREANVTMYTKIAQSLASSGHIEEAKDILDQARVKRDIDFFILKMNGEPVVWSTGDGTLTNLDIPVEPINQPLITEHLSWITVPIEGGYVLTTGIIKNYELYLELQKEAAKGMMFDELFFFIMIGLGVFAYYLRDITQILKLFQKSNKRDYKKIKTKSLESQMFVQGLSGYEETVDTLSSENQMLGNQVLPSLKKEILSGKKPPYDFACTMVRTDINNFSMIYNTHNVDTFMSVINGFFKEVSHIVSLYNGLIHEFVGDEVIFYFKDEEHKNSFMIALSAIRDINAAAARINLQTVRDHGYPFTVKSSLASGVIRFGPLVNGYSIAGSVLIETVRILSHIMEKEGNIVYFEESSRDRVLEICDVREGSRVLLKGYAGTKTLYSYEGHKSLHSVLAKLSPETVEYLNYYRSDKDLVDILQFLRSHHHTMPLDLVLKVIQTMRSFKVTQTSGQPVRELVEWLDELHRTIGQSEQDRWYKTISSAAMLTISLVPKPAFSEAIEQTIARLLGLKNKRVVANILEVLTHFKAGADGEFLDRLIGHIDNRIAANAIVHEGQRNLSPQIVKRLTKMVGSKKPNQMASALFALGELAAFHRNRDAVYYSTQMEFLKLINILPNYVQNESEMVRRQALIAARKSEDEKVLETIRSRAIKDKTGVLAQELAMYLQDSNQPVMALIDGKRAA